MQVTARLNRHHLRAALCAVPKHDIRHYIMGVQVEIYPDQTLMVSTNGNLMAVLRDTNETAGAQVPMTGVKFLLPVSLAESVRANKHLAYLTVKFDTDTQDLTLEDFGAPAITAKAVDGLFPDWRRVLPDDVSGEAARFNPEYYALFIKVAKALGENETRINIKPSGGLKGALVYFHKRVDFLGVLMPILAFDDLPVSPSVFKAVTTAPTEEDLTARHSTEDTP